MVAFFILIGFGWLFGAGLVYRFNFPDPEVAGPGHKPLVQIFNLAVWPAVLTYRSGERLAKFLSF